MIMFTAVAVWVVALAVMRDTPHFRMFLQVFVALWLFEGVYQLGHVLGVLQ